MTREELYTALFVVVSAIPGFRLYRRRLISLEDLSDAELPAVLMHQVQEEKVVVYGVEPAKYTATVNLVIVCSTPANPRDAVPMETLNPLMDAVELTFGPPEYLPFPHGASGIQNLGLDDVYQCFVAGPIEIFEGISSTDKSFAIMPLKIIYSL